MKRKPGSRLWLYFTGCVFGVSFGGLLMMLTIWWILYLCGMADAVPIARPPIFVFLLASIHIGSLITVFVGRTIIQPIQDMGEAFARLSAGDFSVRVPTDRRIEEIREMAEQFNAMAFDLSHIETLRSDFVTNVSHEFKTPIASIEGYATILQDPTLTQEKREYYVEKIIANSRRLSNMASNILILSKLENQETVLNKREYRLDEQLRRCILLLENRWAAKDIEFDLELPKLIFYGNEALLDQVWYNLLDNAVKHSPVGGVIEVRMSADEGKLAVTIADHGEGMTEDVQRHIFEKFYQADRSRTGEGNGLGLALVERIVELCRGHVCVESRPGRGSAFTVELPMG